MLDIIPDSLNDLDQLMTDKGIACGDVWYHGTASGLLANIEKQGLIGGGDQELIDRTQQTLGTIGGRQFETQEPVFLTQSKALAYYWAVKKTHVRNMYFQKQETPVVLKVTSTSVKPDVGGAALIMEPNNEYINFLKEAYEKQGLKLVELDPRTAKRDDYINQLGLAYTLEEVVANHIEPISVA